MAVKRRKLQLLVTLYCLAFIAWTSADEKLKEKDETEESNSDVYGNIDHSPDLSVMRKAGSSESLGQQGGQLIQENVENYDEEQGKQFHSDKEESDNEVNIKDKNSRYTEKEDTQSEQIAALDNNTEPDSNQSYFSFGNILRSIVDPVFDELGKDIKIDSTAKNQNQTTNATLNQTDISLQLNISQNDTKLRGIEVVGANKTEKKTKFQCQGRNNTNLTDIEIPEVKIVNNTVLLNMLNFDKNESSDCILVMFFAPWCHFCAQTAPNYNALARAFPKLDVVAVDAAQFSNLNARFGTVSVPNILLFHNSKAVVRFNQTDRGFENLAMFVKNITGLVPNTTLNVTEEDYMGPLPSTPTEDSDYLLWVAWVFVIIFSSFMFVQSTYGQQCINKVKILWQEHQHID